MKFSLRDLLFVMLLIGLGAAWLGDRLRLKAEIADLQQRMVEEVTRTLGGYELIPKAGSPEAMSMFLTEVKKEHRPPHLEVATNLCFLTGSPAAKYKLVLDEADRTGLSLKPRFSGGTEYEFWCDSKDPRNADGDFFVLVVVRGSPAVIEQAEVTCYMK